MTTSMSTRQRRLGIAQALALLVAVVIGVVAVLVRGGSGAAGSASVPHGAALAAHFLDSYVTSDGRVVRHDQGGDIVSEGEAYAMVLAEVAQRPSVVRTVWRWTRSHLQRPDGLLSYHATGDGHVLDPQSAADADTLSAYALLSYRGPAAAALHRDGSRLAAAVLAHETVGDQSGGLVLVAGPWATSSPATVDPSYLMPPVFRALAAYTGESRWNQLADTSVRLVQQMTNGGHQLPSDWARLQGSQLSESPAPSGDGSVSYGPDAARTPVWFAFDCSSDAQGLAAAWWALLRAHPDAMTLSPQGDVVNGDRVPLSLVAGWAAARAAHDGGSSVLLAQAIAQAHAQSTYYGDAWAAFGEALDGGAWHIAACSPGS